MGYFTVWEFPNSGAHKWTPKEQGSYCQGTPKLQKQPYCGPFFGGSWAFKAEAALSRCLPSRRERLFEVAAKKSRDLLQVTPKSWNMALG